jgi:hypothetical protein
LYVINSGSLQVCDILRDYKLSRIHVVYINCFPICTWVTSLNQEYDFHSFFNSLKETSSQRRLSWSILLCINRFRPNKARLFHTFSCRRQFDFFDDILQRSVDENEEVHELFTYMYVFMIITVARFQHQRLVWNLRLSLDCWITITA